MGLLSRNVIWIINGKKETAGRKWSFGKRNSKRKPHVPHLDAFRKKSSGLLRKSMVPTDFSDHT